MQLSDLPSEMLLEILNRLPAADVAGNCTRVRRAWRGLAAERAEARLPLEGDFALFELRGEASPVAWMVQNFQQHGLDATAAQSSGALLAQLVLSADFAGREASLEAYLRRRAPRLRELVLSPSWMPFCDSPGLIGAVSQCRQLRRLEVNGWLDEAAVAQLPPSLEALALMFHIGLDVPSDLAGLASLPVLRRLEVTVSDAAVAHPLLADKLPPASLDQLCADTVQVLRSVCRAGRGLRELRLSLPPALHIPLPRELWQLEGLKQLRVDNMARLDASAVEVLADLPLLKALQLNDVLAVGAAAGGLSGLGALRSLALSGWADSLETLPALLGIPQLTMLEINGFGRRPSPASAPPVLVPGVPLTASRLELLRLNVAGVDDDLLLDLASLAAAPALRLVQLRCDFTTVLPDGPLADELRAAALADGAAWQDLRPAEALRLQVLVQQPYARTEAPSLRGGPQARKMRKAPRPISISGAAQRRAAA